MVFKQGLPVILLRLLWLFGAALPAKGQTLFATSGVLPGALPCTSGQKRSFSANMT
jgi:hypothetical protein